LRDGVEIRQKARIWTLATGIETFGSDRVSEMDTT
jgi:hypothetical protein